MTTLTFDRAGVEKVLDDLRTAKEFRQSYLDPEDQPAKPTVWFVGDDGIYLMSNAVIPEGKKSVIVYANECNPDTMEFDSWWNFKRNVWGGDDGAEAIDPKELAMVLASYRPGQPLQIDMHHNTFSIIYFRAKSTSVPPSGRVKKSSVQKTAEKEVSKYAPGRSGPRFGHKRKAKEVKP